MLHSKPTYGVQDAAELLNLSRTTVYKEINAGRLRTYKVGSKRRFISADAIDQYIRDREAETSAA